MLRGFRWQFLALLVSFCVFMIALLTRNAPSAIEPTSPPPTATQTSTFAPTDTSIPPTLTVAQATPSPANTQPLSPTYREALVGQVQRINPVFAGLNPVDRDISSLIFEGLIRINEYGEPVPALATEWVISGDGLEYVVTLREDVLWQDGLPFTADDVLYTMSILSAPDYPGPSEIREFWQTIETQKLTDRMVRFRLTQPLSSFLSNLSIGILPVHALQGTTAEQLWTHPFNLSPIGTGAYQLNNLYASDGETLDQVELKLSPVYQQRPESQRSYSLETIEFHLFSSFDDAVNAFQSGQVDGLATQQPEQRGQLLALSNGQVLSSIDPTLGVLIFNWNEEVRFFGDKRVRLALQQSLDVDNLIEAHLSDVVVADSPLLLNSWAYRSIPNPFNLAEAQAQLTNANIQLTNISGTEGTDSLQSFTILIPQNAGLESLAEAIAQSWRALILDVQVEAVDGETYWSRLENGEFDTAIVEQQLGTDPDVYRYWDAGQSPDGLNWGAVNDSTISEVLESARQDANGILRAQLYDTFQRTFVDQAIAIPLYYPLFTYVVRNSVQNVQLGFLASPADRFRNIGDWVILLG